MSDTEVTNNLLRGITQAVCMSSKLAKVAAGPQPYLGYPEFMAALEVTGQYAGAESAYIQWNKGKTARVIRQAAKVLGATAVTL